jgi:hypothetical protein
LRLLRRDIARLETIAGELAASPVLEEKEEPKAKSKPRSKAKAKAETEKEGEA